MHSSRICTVRRSGCRGWGEAFAQGGVCPLWGGVYPGGDCPGGVSAWGVHPSMHWGRHHPTPGDGMLDTGLWKHYLSTTTLRTVIKVLCVSHTPCIRMDQESWPRGYVLCQDASFHLAPWHQGTGTKSITPRLWILRHWGSNRLQQRMHFQ